MIPEELHLKNFLSHLDTRLDLRGVHLASLVGENGAGKSALLDAITWAVWGKSRVSYGHDEDLIYHGQQSLEVEYLFRMSYQNGEERHFRILRRRELRGRGSTTTSILDFQSQGENGNWVAINGNTIRETQARIAEQLGLDYETFINSAYLRQGNADEFTVQTPAQRKRVLGAILGLERWEEYRGRVKERLSKTEVEQESVQRRLVEINAELARREEYEKELAVAEREATVAGQQLEELEAQVNEIYRIREQAKGIQRQIAELAGRLGQEEERLAELSRQQETHRQRRDDYQARLAAEKEIKARYEQYQATLAEERAWSEKLGEAARLQAEKSRWEKGISRAGADLHAQLRTQEQEATRQERAIAAARAQIEEQLGDLRGQLRMLAERLLSDEETAEWEAAKVRLAALTQLAAELDETRVTAQEAELERSRRQERNRQLKALMDETKANLDALVDADALCPLCRQSLSVEHQAEMLEQIRAEGQAMGDEYRANQQRLQELKEQRKALRAAIRAQERELRQRPRVEQTVARWQQQREQAAEASARSVALREEVAALQTRLQEKAYSTKERVALAAAQQASVELQRQLDADDYAAEERAALGIVLAELSELGYQAAAHEAVKERVQKLSVAEEEYRELEKARVGLQGEDEALVRLAHESDKQRARVTQLAAAHAAQEGELNALRPRLEGAAHLLTSLKRARQRAAQARQRVGMARQTLAALETQEQRRARFQAQRQELASRAGLLKELWHAFGVNGIPAMIIEHTLPELEREANRLLEQLTGGRMHIRFDTQRETKAGSVRETLDIFIGDEKGTRPYENFSGGEKFRINFAIRVALSHLLAQRAGVRLRSLFIDEGFGSLDSDGRRRLVEAIKAVQGEFDLILMITHIEELRDSFPTKIQVTKTETGSQVRVV